MHFWCPSCSKWVTGIPAEWPLSDMRGHYFSFRSPLVLMHGAKVCRPCVDEVMKLVDELE